MAISLFLRDRVCAGLITLLFLTSCASAAQLVYDIYALNADIFGDYNGSEAIAITNDGYVIGHVWKLEGNTKQQSVPAVWDMTTDHPGRDSHLMPIPTASMRMLYPQFTDMNNSGIAVGHYSYADQDGNYHNYSGRAFRYDIINRTLIDLGSLGDDSTDDPFTDENENVFTAYPAGISDSGNIVGSSKKQNDYGFVGAFSHPCYWDGPTQIFENKDDIGMSLYDVGAGYAIGELHTNSGGISRVQAIKVPLSGSYQILPVPAEYADNNIWARDINESGSIIGWVDGQSVLWHPTEGFMLLPNVHGYDWSTAWAINSHNSIAGRSNGAVVWHLSGTSFGISYLDQLKTTPGWELITARDINDLGWVLGDGTYLGMETAFIAKPRVDNAPPVVTMASDDPLIDASEIKFSVIYADDSGISTDDLDDQDITIESNTLVSPAEFDEVEEIDPQNGLRRWQADYIAQTPPFNPYAHANTLLDVVMQPDQVSDLAGIPVDAGIIGTLSVTMPADTATIFKGAFYDPATTSLTYKFQTEIYLTGLDAFFTIQSVQCLPPGASQWLDLTNQGTGRWLFEQTATTYDNLSAFGDGDYDYIVTLLWDQTPYPLEMTFSFADVDSGSSFTLPETASSITYPKNNAVLPTPQQIAITWNSPSAPSATSQSLIVTDQATHDVVFSLLEEEPPFSASTAPLNLKWGHSYQARLIVADGAYNQEQNDWTTHCAKLQETSITFTVGSLLGDLNNSGRCDLADFTLLHNAWQTTPTQNNWNSACDIYPDNIIDFQDLTTFAKYWLK